MKKFILLFSSLLACLALSLLLLISWPRPSLPVRSPVIPTYNSIFIEKPETQLNYEKCTKKELISFCLKNLENIKTLSRALHFYEQTWRSSGTLKKVLESHILNEDSPPLLTFWYTKGTENKVFFLNQLEERAKRLWQIKESYLKAALLTRFLYEYIPDKVAATLKEIFHIAQKSDDIRLMLSLISLMGEYKVEPLDTNRATTAQNLLADATYLYNIGRAQEAQDRLTLVTFMDSNNEKAE